MAIKYNAKYNEEIRSIVRNFNKRRNRAEKAGYTNLPPLAKVSELKARYSSRNELERALGNLERFRHKTLEKIENRGGAKSIAWEYQNIKANLNAARQFHRREYDRIAHRIGKFPGERLRLDAIAAKISLLDKDINYLNQDEFRSYRSAVLEYINFPLRVEKGYRGFLSEIDLVMDRLQFSNERKENIFEKFKELTPEQLFYVYNENDLVGRIYDLIDSPIYDGTGKMNESEEYAEDLLTTLEEELDDIIEDAKTKA